jgi:hypothetical protein
MLCWPAVLKANDGSWLKEPPLNLFLKSTKNGPVARNSKLESIQPFLESITRQEKLVRGTPQDSGGGRE